jgi:hypothetical protein
MALKSPVSTVLVVVASFRTAGGVPDCGVGPPADTTCSVARIAAMNNPARMRLIDTATPSST